MRDYPNVLFEMPILSSWRASRRESRAAGAREWGEGMSARSPRPRNYRFACQMFRVATDVVRRKMEKSAQGAIWFRADRQLGGPIGVSTGLTLAEVVRDDSLASSRSAAGRLAARSGLRLNGVQVEHAEVR